MYVDQEDIKKRGEEKEQRRKEKNGDKSRARLDDQIPEFIEQARGWF